MLTVCCVYVAGPFPYTAEYVRRLEKMVRRYLARPFRFVVFTDRASELPDFFTVPVPSLADDVPRNGVGYWAKVRLFDPRYAVVNEGRVLYLDLDSLIVNDLSPIVDFPSAFALTEDALVHERAHLERDRFNRLLVRKFNSSVMVWDGGTQSAIWTDWTPAVAARLSTDQDWIAEHAPHAQAMPLSWFPRISRQQPPWPDETKVVLTKKPKNAEACTRWPWFEPAWGGWA